MRKAFILILAIFFTISGCKKEKDTTPQGEQSQLPIELSTTPDSLSFTDFQRSSILYITRKGEGAILSWKIASIPQWVNVSSDSGTVANINGEVVVTIQDALAMNSYSGEIQITSNTNSKTIYCTATIINTGVLSISSDTVNFDYNDSTLNFYIKNIGNSPFNWTLNADQNWITSSDSSGSISSADSTKITISVYRTGLSRGIHIGKLTITADNGQQLTAIIKMDNNTFTITKTGQFYHNYSNLKDAYDLVNDVELGDSALFTNQDMKNDDYSNNFTGRWYNASSNTYYVKVNNYDYNNAGYESAKAGYFVGYPSSYVSYPYAGDIYIARLRGGDNYAVIKIISIDPSDSFCGCPYPGKLTFEYKK